jgi:hypothetical protein
MERKSELDGRGTPKRERGNGSKTRRAVAREAKSAGGVYGEDTRCVMYAR